MKQILCLLLIILTIALIVGCKVEKEAPPETSAAADVDDVEEGLSEVDTLDEELDLSEFEELEKELEDVTW